MVQDLRLGISTLSDVSENFRPHSLSQAGSMFRMAFRMSLWGFPCKVRDNLMVRKRHETVVLSKKCLQNFVRGFQNFVRSLFFSLRSLFFLLKSLRHSREAGRPVHLHPCRDHPPRGRLTKAENV